MVSIVNGIYKDGKVELTETPKGLREGRVRVVLIEESHEKPPACPLTFGKYRSGPFSTEDSFKEAEWHGEEEFDDSYGK